MELHGHTTSKIKERRFRYYSCMVRPTEKEAIAIEKINLLQLPRGRGTLWGTMGPYGEMPGWVKKKREHEGNMGTAFTVVSRKRTPAWPCESLRTG